MSRKNRGNADTQTDGGGTARANEDRAAAIAHLAYQKWQARGCPEGDDRRDWFEAEQELSGAGTTQAEAGEAPAARKQA